MNSHGPPNLPGLPVEFARKVDHVCRQFESAWRLGHRPSIEEYLGSAQGPLRAALLVELLALELELRLASGERPTIWQYKARFPQYDEVIRRTYAECVEGAVTRRPGEPPPRGDDSPSVARGMPHERAPFAARSPSPGLGRYRILRKLGSDQRGQLFQAHDPQMVREVAIRVAYDPSLSAAQLECFLQQGRRLTELNHPAIVPIYEAGVDETGRRFVVSRYVPGARPLAERLGTDPPDRQTRISWIADLAEALQHAHQLGLLHGDLRPANILVDELGQPQLVDFAPPATDPAILERPGEEGRWQSPEQRAGEEHRVDGRSDVFALGTLLHWLLTGSLAQPLDDTSLAPGPSKPLSTTEQSGARCPPECEIPDELSAIVRRARARRPTDRFDSPGELAAALREFLSGGTAGATAAATTWLVELPATLHPLRPGELAPSTGAAVPSASAAARFPCEIDAFWRSRLAARRPADSFDIGLLYGPPGSGKTSFLRACLLPALSPDLLTVYVEASPADTCRRLLQALQKSLADLPREWDGAQTLAAIRRETVPVAQAGVLLVIDQCERLLDAGGEKLEELEELVRMLRQCAAPRLRCLLVSDDAHWSRLGMLFDGLELELSESRNCRRLDPLTSEALAEALRRRRALDGDQGFAPKADPHVAPKADQTLIQEVVRDVAACGPLTWGRAVMAGALLREIGWDVQRWRALQPAQDLEFRYLDSALRSCASSTPKADPHALAKLLASLLAGPPDDSSCPPRRLDALRQSAGITGAQAAACLDILERQLGVVERVERDESSGDQGPLYRPTHDFLIPALRRWVERQYLQSAGGRARAALAAHGSVTDPRHVPSWNDWLLIRCRTRPTDWHGRQRAMMQRADRRYAAATCLGCLALAGLLIAAWWML